MITVSAAEFSVTVTKACLGAGIERGIAEEIGPACMELALHDLPSLTALLDALGNEADSGQSVRWARSENGWRTDRVDTLAAAVSMIDFASIAGSDGAGADSVTQPAICIGVALHRARHSDRIVETKVDRVDWLDVEASLNTIGNMQGDGPFTFRFRQADALFKRVDISAIEVPKQDWQSLDFWTSKTLVPADEASRSDAGAGNTDND